MEYIDINDVKDTDTSLPAEARFTSTGFVTDVDYRIDFSDDTVRLDIGAGWFTRKDLKELRKLIKRLEGIVT